MFSPAKQETSSSEGDLQLERRPGEAPGVGSLRLESGRQRVILDYVRRTSVVVYFLTFVFIYTTAQIDLSEYLYYLLFSVVLIMIGLWVETDSQDARGVVQVEVFPRSSLRLSELPAQCLGGFVFALGFVVVALSIGSLSLRSGVGISEFIGDMIPQIIIIGGVETLMLIVYLKVLFLGGYIYPVIFAFSHTRIAALWSQGLFPVESIVFVIYAVSQAVIFLAIYSGRVLVPRPFNGLFGPVAVAVYHGVVNTVTLHSVIGPIGGV